MGLVLTMPRCVSSPSPISRSLTRSPKHSTYPRRYTGRHAQNLNLQTLVSILNSTKATEIPSVLKALSPDAQDTLMKYLYKGMALPGWGDVSGSVLLGWHEKVRLSPPSLSLPLMLPSTWMVKWMYADG